MRNISVATRLAVAIVVVAILSLVATTLIGLNEGERLTDELAAIQDADEPGAPAATAGGTRAGKPTSAN